MLRYGAECNFPDDWADELFEQALREGDLMTVISFIHYSDVNRRVNGDRTPLMHAAANGHDFIVEDLLEQNVKIELVDQNGRTAADLATENGYDDIADLLASQPAG